MNQISTPFDVNIANTRDDGALRSHEVIDVNVIDQIVTTLINANVVTSQKLRIGSTGSANASPSSSYWSAAGIFDTPRYILPQSIRELPVVRDAEADAALWAAHDDKAVRAAVIAAR